MGPRQVAPAIHGRTWVASARAQPDESLEAKGPPSVEGHGNTAEAAMADLANQRALPDGPNG
jgi:hypothetical protein